VKSTSLASLLDLLHQDPPQAAIAYHQLHARLARFFSINHTDDPVHLADIAMDRLALRSENPDTTINSPISFALGIARHLLQENTRHRLRDEEASKTWTTITPLADPHQEERRVALDLCLSKLTPERRQLIESYYAWNSKEKVEHHRRIAEHLGLNLNALRNRVLRIRAQVETCLRQRLSDVSPQSDTLNRTARRGNDPRD
jgi:DNA-directed RNA polymerase specialized sigma24 family protein